MTGLAQGRVAPLGGDRPFVCCTFLVELGELENVFQFPTVRKTLRANVVPVADTALLVVVMLRNRKCDLEDLLSCLPTAILKFLKSSIRRVHLQ